MKRKLLAALPIAALLAGGSSALTAQSTGSAEAPSQDAFAPIARYAITYDHPRDLAEFYLRDFGFKPGDANIAQFDDPRDSSRRVVVVTVDDVEDEAVRSLQLRLGMRASSGSWETTDAGMRRKCNRGPNTDAWTRDVCPA